MRIFYLISASILFFTFSGISQDYQSSIGLKGGNGISGSYKISAGDVSYFELLGGFDFKDSDFYIMAYFEKHRELGDSDIKWYHGPGAGVTFIENTEGVGETAFAAGWIIGLDFAFSEVPLNVSLDLSPKIIVGGNRNLMPFYGMAIRYILN